MLENAIKYVIAVLALIVGLGLGYAVGHWRGAIDGKTAEMAKNAVVTTKAAQKASADRDKHESESRKLSESAIDAELSGNGWMRPGTGN